MRSFIRYCLHHAKRRHTVNNNTLCDARKLQKNAVSRCIIRIFVQKSHVSFHGLISIYPSFYIAGMQQMRRFFASGFSQEGGI